MRIDERIASGSEPAFSFEFFPPKTDEGEANLETALHELARLDPTFVSVTYGAGGTPAQRGNPPAGVDAKEWVAADGGLRYSRELIELIRADYDFAVGAACFPEVHLAAESADSDLRYTREKVEAGAKFLITQLFFD